MELALSGRLRRTVADLSFELQLVFPKFGDSRLSVVQVISKFSQRSVKIPLVLSGTRDDRWPALPIETKSAVSSNRQALAGTIAGAQADEAGSLRRGQGPAPPLPPGRTHSPVRQIPA